MTRTMSEGTAMLTLPIKRQWFDEILLGTKTIEYREIKPYWTSRFMKVTVIEGDPEEAVWKLKRRFNGQNVYFDALFRNGYEPDSPFFIAECYVDIGPGEPEWSYSYEEFFRVHIVSIRKNEKKVEEKAEKRGQSFFMWDCPCHTISYQYRPPALT